MSEEKLYCSGCKRPLDDALIMVCDHNLCLNCARQGLQDSVGTNASKPQIRCWVCLQWTPLEPSSAAMLRDAAPALGPSPGSLPQARPGPSMTPGGPTSPYQYTQDRQSLPGFGGGGGGGYRGNQQFEVPQVACKLHPNEPVQFFCLECENGCICAECALHGEHSTHMDKVMSLKKAYPHVRGKIEEMLASYSERLDDIKQNEIALEGRMRHLAAVSEQAKQHTSKVFALVRDCVAEKERELLARIGEVIKQRADSVDREATALRSRKAQLDENANLISRHMQLENEVGTLAWYADAKAILNEIGPDPRAPSQALEINQDSIRSLGVDIETVCDKLRGLVGVHFHEDGPRAVADGLRSMGAVNPSQIDPGPHYQGGGHPPGQLNYFG